MSRRTDPTVDGVPVRQVADLILSFGLDLPAAPAARRGATRTAVPAPRAAHDAWAPEFEPVLRPATLPRPRRPHQDTTGRATTGRPTTGRPTTGRHGLREDDGDHTALGEPAVGRTVAVSPEVLAKARRMAFNPSHPSARTTRARVVARPELPAPRRGDDEAWAPAAGATTMPPPVRREPEPTVVGPAGPATQWIGEPTGIVPVADAAPVTELVPVTAPDPITAFEPVSAFEPVTALVPVADETAYVPYVEQESDDDGPGTPATSRPATVLRPARSRASRPMFLATASVASVAVVGAAAAAVVGFTGTMTPTAATTSTDLKAALPAAKPATAPPTAPAAADSRPGTAEASDGPAPGTVMSDEYRDTTKKVADALPAALNQGKARQVVAKAKNLVPAVSGSGRGAGAVTAAMAQLGTPYKWGGASPSGFDCSGLVVYAFKQLGIALPHSAAALSTMGTAVSKADLQPGDLVFFYTPVSHAAIYIGNGKVVNATNEGEPVQVSDLSDFPMHNARRL